MTTKKTEKKLTGGLAKLIGGADKPLNQTTNSEAEVTDAAEQKEQAEEATPEEEQDLINSIEDEDLKARLIQKRNEKRGRPRKDAAARLTQEQEYTRFCTLVKREQIIKLKEICLRETLTLKEVLDEIFQNAIEAYENKYGEIFPKNHKGDVTKLFK